MENDSGTTLFIKGFFLLWVYLLHGFDHNPNYLIIILASLLESGLIKHYNSQQFFALAQELPIFEILK